MYDKNKTIIFFIMKKTLFYILLLVSCFGIKAQDTIFNPEQYYLFPPDCSICYVRSFDIIEREELQYGMCYTVQSEGMKIYGIALALEYETIPEDKHVFLYEDTDNGIKLVDSSKFLTNDVHLLKLSRHDTNLYIYKRIYHTFFTRPHNIDQHNFYVTYGNSKFNPVSCFCSPPDSCCYGISQVGYLITPTSRVVIHDCLTISQELSDSYICTIPTYTCYGYLPIINRNLWQPCMPVTGLRASVYHDHVIFLWDEAYRSCNYELKWGLANDDTSNYQTYNTSNTMVAFTGLERDQEYACLVRSQCLCNDSLWGSEWGPWSDTIHFRRTRFIDAGSNNPDWGYVVGGGHYDLWDTVTLEAIPSSSRSTFVSWSDSSTANPRTIIVSQDLTLTAIFAVDSTGLEDSTSITTAAQQRITLVPNPATNSVTITAETEILSVDAYNVKGQRIATAECHDTTLKLDTSTWPNGTYTITIYTTNGTVTRKLVINKG